MKARLVYSLLKPAVRAAARFRLPIRSLVELLRLAYFEHLRRDQGLEIRDIAERFGQSERHMRTLAQKLESDFFEAERAVGLAREVEARVGGSALSAAELKDALSNWTSEEVDEAIEELLEEERLERDAEGRLRAAQRYVVLRGDGFQNRIDSLNHFFDGAYRSAMQRLVNDDGYTSMMKSLSFSAIPSMLRPFLDKLEGDLRRELAVIDEAATFQGRADDRYTMIFGLAPHTDETQ